MWVVLHSKCPVAILLHQFIVNGNPRGYKAICLTLPAGPCPIRENFTGRLRPLGLKMHDAASGGKRGPILEVMLVRKRFDLN